MRPCFEAGMGWSNGNLQSQEPMVKVGLVFRFVGRDIYTRGSSLGPARAREESKDHLNSHAKTRHKTRSSINYRFTW